MSNLVKTVSIPFKIKRSPTDLLKALSNTVKLDSNRPNYALIDDTILTPLNPNETRRFILAKASGIKAARFMIQKYPQAFMKDDCEPHVQSFFPEKEFTEQDLKYPSEDLIYSLMNWGKFFQAYDTYLKCKDQNIEVSEECKHILLDLLSINNSGDIKERVPIEEGWFVKGQTRDMESRPKFVPQNTWKKGAEAEQMFNELRSKTTQAYCSLIKGMAMYKDYQSACNMYDEMKHYNLVPDLNTINAMIKLIRMAPNEISSEKKIDLMMEKLNDIKNYEMMPNLKTFNSCFELIKSFNLFQNSVPLTLNLYKEMQNLKIEPSLATFSHIISIFYPNKDTGAKTEILRQAIERVEAMANGQNGIEWKDVDDGTFFKNAMEKLSFGNAKNLRLVSKLHSILLKDNNIRFLNDSYLFNRYFELYLNNLIKFDNPENVINEWRTFTPYIFNRSIFIVEKMIEFVYQNRCFDFVPEIWSNFIELRAKRSSDFCSNFIATILKTMVEYNESNLEFISQYGTICEIIIKKYPYHIEKVESDEESNFVPVTYYWNSQMLSNLFTILLKCDKLDIAYAEFENFMKNQNKIAGELSEKCVTSLCESFIKANQSDRAFEVLNLAVSIRLPNIKELILKIKAMNLDSDKRTILDQLKI
ncbi:PTCD3 mitochondrial [Brachionus plicatilis]|uniref:Small ribosomal subunit protein mS39 n=1 Tax=Brachionus plicatilis TaxID=10195 RepID=A0A3M7PEK4_BRAPC|nr:PTCD3 mitochondrial [Brachionus plicatilis]